MNQLLLIAVLVFAPAVAFAHDTPSGLSLTITLSKGQILGVVRNDSSQPVTVTDIAPFGWWEFTTVFYCAGQTWHEAVFKPNAPVFVRGAFKAYDVTLQPGQILKEPHPDLTIRDPGPPQGDYTFVMNLSDYHFQEGGQWVSALRVVTNGRWSNIVGITNPRVDLVPPQ